jgi:hypothetical protein
MAGRQAVLVGTFDVGAVDAVEARLAASEAVRCAAHAEVLRDALELLGLYERAGMWDAAPAQLALLLRSSEQRATTLLTCARVLAELPGGFELLEAAVLTVEQAAAVGRVLDPLPGDVRQAVWAHAVTRLQSDVQRGAVCPPARLTELLRTWAAQVDPDSALDRRRQAEAAGSVLLDRRDDGLTDLVLRGLTTPLADAVLSRIGTVAESTSFVGDERSSGKQRLDTAVDLLLGRTGRPAGQCAPAAGADGEAAGCGGGCGGGCGCPLGAPAPCGASVTVLVPLATALGHGDVPAQQGGAGPLEPDLLAALLSAAPVLRGVWVDPDGQPVADSPIVVRTGRGNADSVRQALRRIVAAGPGTPRPRHPDDHPDDDGDDGGDGDGPPGRSPADGPAPPARPPPGRRPRPRVLTHPHPPDLPGPYRPPAALRRFLAVRAPRCEWPGCGTRAARCDLDHDLAHPHGPTCPCNLGPLCRRHHRLKQLGWTKQRTPHGVLWTGPTLRTTLSPPQHPAVPTVRPARPTGTALDHLSPAEREDVLLQAGVGTP